jgi:Ca2+-binding EF-hand superfamily protein
LYPAKWSKMLTDVGLKLKPTDITQGFNFFDVNHNGFVSIEEFTSILGLTDYELDLALDKIRLKLLLPCIPKDVLKAVPVQQANPNLQKQLSGVIGGDHASHPYIGKNKIRESITLMQIFNMVNIKKDSILSLDEMMDLAYKVEVFVTEEEARKLLTMMDMDGDDRVEEHDFIAFMRRESQALVNKAFRIREAAAYLRRWLVRGTTEKMDNNSTATASKSQWKWFKHRYEKALGQKFPGFLSAPVLQSTFLVLGIRLSAIEARELTLLIAPEKTGRIHLADLHGFMGRSCRSIGELIACLERDIFSDLIDAYRAHTHAMKFTGREDSDLSLIFHRKVEEIQKFVENVYAMKDKKAKDAANPPSTTNPKTGAPKDALFDEDDDEPVPTATMAVSQSQDLTRFLKGSHEVISLNHLKTGVHEWLLHQSVSKKLNENIFLNMEEWGLISVLVDADVAEGDIYGIKLKNLLTNLCAYILSSNEATRMKTGEKISLEIVARELKMQIYREAKLSAGMQGRNKKPDYLKVFNLFDDNKNGSISLNEFKTMLKKLQLISALSDHQIPNLLAMFDKGKRGVIAFDDFKSFAEDGEKLAQEEDDNFFRMNRAAGPGAEKTGGGSKGVSGHFDEQDLDDEDLEDDIDIISDIPPLAITRNSDCDWLVWFLYRQACHLEPMDPESVVIDLESLCHETEMTTNDQDISIKEFWNILFELKLQGNMQKQQYLKGIQLLCLHGNNRDDDRVDYSTLCKYVIRMGRSYNGLLQEKRKEMEKNFHPLLMELKRYFKQLCDET